MQHTVFNIPLRFRHRWPSLEAHERLFVVVVAIAEHLRIPGPDVNPVHSAHHEQWREYFRCLVTHGNVNIDMLAGYTHIGLIPSAHEWKDLRVGVSTLYYTPGSDGGRVSTVDTDLGQISYFVYPDKEGKFQLG